MTAHADSWQGRESIPHGSIPGDSRANSRTGIDSRAANRADSRAALLRRGGRDGIVEHEFNDAHADQRECSNRHAPSPLGSASLRAGGPRR
jgi:hypothetical protein